MEKMVKKKNPGFYPEKVKQSFLRHEDPVQCFYQSPRFCQ